MLLNCGVGEDSFESPLDCKEIQAVHSEGDQPWDFFGRNDAEAETPVLWPPHAKSWLIGKDSDAERDWGQEEKGTTEDEMAGWYHRLNGRESEWTLGVGAGQGGLACCDSWGGKESDTTEQLNWTEHKNLQWLTFETMSKIQIDMSVLAILFIIAKKWKQPKCPSADRWINKLWFIHTIKCYLSIKCNKVLVWWQMNG